MYDLCTQWFNNKCRLKVNPRRPIGTVRMRRDLDHALAKSPLAKPRSSCRFVAALALSGSLPHCNMHIRT
jgi:hypothetical protein